MKENDIKLEKGHRIVMYVEKPDGRYVPIQTGSYMTANYIDDFFWKRQHFRWTAWKKVISGDISSIAYYMQSLEMGYGDLACRIGISRRQLKRHLTPKGFRQMSIQVLERYARVFRVPVTNLLKIPEPDDRDIVQSKTS